MKRRKDLSNSKATSPLPTIVVSLLQRRSPNIRLRLEQPSVMCHGRKKVEWHGKGTIVFEGKGYMLIKFKTKGMVVTTLYDLITKQFVDEKYRDIKIVED